jgi:hypothetical protein
MTGWEDPRPSRSWSRTLPRTGPEGRQATPGRRPIPCFNRAARRRADNNECRFPQSLESPAPYRSLARREAPAAGIPARETKPVLHRDTGATRPAQGPVQRNAKATRRRPLAGRAKLVYFIVPEALGRDGAGARLLGAKPPYSCPRDHKHPLRSPVPQRQVPPGFRRDRGDDPCLDTRQCLMHYPIGADPDSGLVRVCPYNLPGPARTCQDN